MMANITWLISAVITLSICFALLQFQSIDSTQYKSTSNPPKHHCEHNEEVNQTKNGECYKLLFPAVSSRPAWFFLGDSQMNKLTENIKYPYEIHSTRLPGTWGRCNLLNYYFLDRSSNWTPPARIGAGQIQGPMVYGLANHYCLDASGPYNRRFSSSSTNFMEYLAVEYASDVEHQSTITNTSQESAVHYMKWTLDNLLLTKEDSVCVVNTGIHDQKLCPGLQNEDTCLEVYTNNVKSYLKLLNTTCGKILWLSITSVRGDLTHPQTNDRGVIWNQRTNETLATLYPDSSYFIDVWNASHHSARRGNIHFQVPYYIQLGLLFSSLMFSE